MNALNLYTVRVGNTGSFFVAAADKDQARAVAEEWAAQHDVFSQAITVKRFSDSRVVFTAEGLS